MPGTDSILPVSDADALVQNLDVERMNPGPDAVNEVVRERHQIAGRSFTGDDIADVGQVQPSNQAEGGLYTYVVRGAASDILRPAGVFTTTQTLTGTDEPYESRYAKGILLVVTTSANPGGGQTLSLKVQSAYDGTTFIDYVDFGVIITAANIHVACLLAPIFTPADLSAGVVASKQVPLPSKWQAVLTPSAGGTWNAVVAYQLIW